MEWREIRCWPRLGWREVLASLDWPTESISFPLRRHSRKRFVEETFSGSVAVTENETMRWKRHRRDAREAASRFSLSSRKRRSSGGSCKEHTKNAPEPLVTLHLLQRRQIPLSFQGTWRSCLLDQGHDLLAPTSRLVNPSGSLRTSSLHPTPFPSGVIGGTVRVSPSSSAKLSVRCFSRCIFR